MTPISPETRQFINEHQSDDVRNLALQARKYPDVDIPAAITQIAGRQIAAEKIYGIRNIFHWSNVLQKSPPVIKQASCKVSLWPT